MNKIRSTISMELMYHNTLMVQSCYNIYDVGNSDSYIRFEDYDM